MPPILTGLSAMVSQTRSLMLNQENSSSLFLISISRRAVADLPGGVARRSRTPRPEGGIVDRRSGRRPDRRPRDRPRIQVFGGLGVAQGTAAGALECELRIKRIGEGPSEVHRMVLARQLLGTR